MIRHGTTRRRTDVVRALVALAVAVAPAVATLMAAPGAVRPYEPPGAAAWRSDPRALPDPATGEPAAVYRFFSALDRAEQRGLAAAYPAVVGNLDGVPVALRYAANGSAGASGGQVLAFDTRGDGRIAEVVGDLSTADRIAVLVPGAGNRVDNFHRGVGGRPHRSPAVHAADLHRAAQRYGSGADRYAVVAWLGYDAPDRLDATAAREDLALAGAVALRRFVAGLLVERPHATVALLGHSYGSTVVGLAARRLPSRVTDLVLYGSPGIGVDHATRLGTSARVWAGLSDRDPMRWAPGVRLFGLGHGTQPADRGFGARVFDTGDVEHHDGYLAPGTGSLAAVARIALTGTDRHEP